jgi:hypothetical protein
VTQRRFDRLSTRTALLISTHPSPRRIDMGLLDAIGSLLSSLRLRLRLGG